MSRIGATPETTVVFYGDKNNWWACYAFWVFQLFGHTNARVMDGGRLKWEKENRPLTRDVPAYAAHAVQGAGARRRRASRVPGRSAGAHEGAGPARRRAKPRGVRRHAHAHAGLPERGRAARRPHPRREEHSLGARDQSRRRHVQDRRRSCARSTATRQQLSPTDSRPSPTAASASAAATHGSRSSTCSGSRT